MPRYLTPLLFGVAMSAGCGGGGGGGSPSSSIGGIAAVANQAANLAPNVLPISVSAGPTNMVNLPLASVTVCTPGNNSVCQTIDGILVDTGSAGLRIQASALSGISLLQQTDAGGDPVVECAQFGSGFTWGPVKIADVRIAGERADSLPIQVIGDAAFSSIPTGCSNTGRSMNTVQSMGVNGYLGIGVFRRDCGIACAQSAVPGIYYLCPPSGCRPTLRTLTEQVANPVSMFADNNNGVIVQLPAIPADGSTNVDGLLIFGIGTQKNNALGNASVFTLNAVTGGITTFYKGKILDFTLIDTGSNALFFQDAGVPACGSNAAGAGFDCPPSTESHSATIQGANGANASVTFNVANADLLLATGNTAFANLASATAWAPFGNHSFDWGLPFFFGRNVFVAIEGANVQGAPPGPFVAF